MVHTKLYDLFLFALHVMPPRMPKSSLSKMTSQLFDCPTISSRIETPADINLHIPRLLPTWSPAALDIEPITGGITNTIYKVTHPTATPRTLIVRIFGGEKVFTSEKRKEETSIFKRLGAAGVAPPLLASFANGRIETFLHAQALTQSEMGAHATCIGVARVLASLHACEPMGAAKVPTLWHDLTLYMNIAKNVSKGFEGVDVPRCLRAVPFIKERIGTKYNNVVFAHNDLLCGNILQGKNRIHLIDFEYSGYNFRGYDIGNFFRENTGGCEDGIIHWDKYPDLRYRRQFCKVYLEASGSTVTDDQVDALVAEAEMFVPCSQLLWGFWALVQSLNPSDFPYVLYARQLFDHFFSMYDVS